MSVSSGSCGLRVGFAFYDHASDDGHLRFVASDTKQEAVVVLNLTTIRTGSDTSCVIQAGEHPWVVHPTCVAWAYATVTTAGAITAGISNSDFTPHSTPLSAELMDRVWSGADMTRQLPPRVKRILQAQGLISADTLPRIASA